MKNKWRPITLSAAAALAVLTAAAAVIMGSTAESFPDTAPVSAAAALEETASDETSSSPMPSGYVVKSKNGMLCIYQDGILLRETDIAVATLPSGDRNALEQGISVSDDAALTQLLEDLGS